MHNTKKISLLLLAADSGEGQFNRLMDPELRGELETDGIYVQESFISQLRHEDLTDFDVVLLMRSAVPGHPKNDLPEFKKCCEWLEAFVTNGGGLVMMFSENYGKSVETLNDLGKRFDISFAFNQVIERDPKKISHLPNMPEGVLVEGVIGTEAPFGKPNSPLKIIIDGGHGTQALICIPGSDWISVLKGSETCCSRPFPEGFYTGSVDQQFSSPIFCTVRNYDNGRVVVFPSSSSLWIANPFLKRWNGYLMRQHDNAGLEFISGMISWSAGQQNLPEKVETARERFKNRFLTDPEEFSFRTVRDEEQKKLRELKAYKFWIGIPPENIGSKEIADRAVDNDYQIVIIINDYDALDSEKWRKLTDEYSKLAKERQILIFPAYQQLDDEGNLSVVFNVEDLPDQRRQYPCSNLLEDLLVKLNGYTAVLAKPGENRMPAWRHGGYTMLEVDSDDDLELYFDRISSCGFISGIYVARDTCPGEEPYSNYLLAEDMECSMDAITENQHRNFISSGPILEKFGIFGPGMIEDDWEGFWYEWVTGDSADLEVRIRDTCDITKVTIWNGEEIFAEFIPESQIFDATIPLHLTVDLRLHVTAENSRCQRLCCSYPVYTRNRYFWAHQGSDQMNDYHNVWLEDVNGSVGIGNKLYESYGFVTCGFAWGDYVRITSPVPWGEIMPQGLEVSSIVGNFQSLHPSPLIKTPDGFDFLNNHRRKLASSDQENHYVESFANGAWLENTDKKTWIGHGDKTFIPTRIFQKSKLWTCKARYHIPKWQPNQPLLVVIDQEVSWLDDFEFCETDSFTLTHSLHFIKDGLQLKTCSKAGGIAQVLSCDELAEDANEINETEKEWDNLGLINLMLQPLFQQKSMTIPSHGCLVTVGDAMGDFAFFDINIPGELFVRSWKLPNGRFSLAIDVVPDHKTFRRGEKINLSYAIGVFPGNSEVYEKDGIEILKNLKNYRS